MDYVAPVRNLALILAPLVHRRSRRTAHKTPLAPTPPPLLQKQVDATTMKDVRHGSPRFTFLPLVMMVMMLAGLTACGDIGPTGPDMGDARPVVASDRLAASTTAPGPAPGQDSVFWDTNGVLTVDGDNGVTYRFERFGPETAPHTVKFYEDGTHTMTALITWSGGVPEYELQAVGEQETVTTDEYGTVTETSGGWLPEEECGGEEGGGEIDEGGGGDDGPDPCGEAENLMIIDCGFTLTSSSLEGGEEPEADDCEYWEDRAVDHALLTIGGGVLTGGAAGLGKYVAKAALKKAVPGGALIAGFWGAATAVDLIGWGICEIAN